MINILTLVKNTTAKFDFYRAGVMYYTVEAESKIYRFPIRLDDIGDATLLKEEKALLLMRYIRKALESNELQVVNGKA